MEAQRIVLLSEDGTRAASAYAYDGRSWDLTIHSDSPTRGGTRGQCEYLPRGYCYCDGRYFGMAGITEVVKELRRMLSVQR